MKINTAPPILCDYYVNKTKLKKLKKKKERKITNNFEDF